MSKTRILITLLLLLSGKHMKAQFNTISCPGNRYKVVVENPSQTTNETEATPESITSENEKSVPDKVALSSTDTKKKEQVARYLSVCYPLSSVKINSPYGYRKDPFTGKRKFHNGIDLHARSSKVFAMIQGRVLKVGQDKVSGKYVTLQHGSFTVSYCHLSQISVSQGQDVLSGDVVGITGNTGRSTGEHLHITCKYNGNYIDPILIFKHIETVQKDCISTLAQL
ncbi:M23 family metallopeptidase [Bacteroides thetaiotaomicron]|uniref:M23 family metallopeptidase n=2 Tax=Bacteroidales TaxID=171549 RepID=UPI00202FC6BD|nr:M23 family metallopeptidase [Bacteroides thetaiotaomicron]MCM1613613.1 M23 family metallopeptidase [Phocaeicola massiliensis]MCM1656876.1 M23 family metallopeptidase [Bacteroides thetaiotaomicron]MCM1661799.1 M23 family metallopeptidase [Bacteroides thetaiotaomicron]MCM1698152.1 M23 family metallopeptidase [Bacteroides thetaiotaomicron]MCM1711605.1 M23 family metallopeptidase [Bacteroides thetaiotaomicron]